MNSIVIIVVNYTTNRITRGPEWNGNLATSGAPLMIVTGDPTITSVTISIRTVTDIIEEITATIHSEETDALIIQITEMYGKQ